ncbi:MAG: hypothetical protein ACLGI9_06305 [Thermoanaerobaculia bacterium]
MDWWIVAIIWGNLAFTIGIIWLVLHHRALKVRRQSEERLRVLERFSSGPELIEFLNSSSGVRLLDLLGSKPDPRRSALTAVAVGTFLLVVGAAFLLLDQLDALGEPGVLMVPGMLTAGAGLGALLSAVISLRLARRLGVLETGRTEDSRS